MQALRCDICGKALHGLAFEFTTLRGEAVAVFDGSTTITNREAARLLQLCAPCGSWIRLGMETVKAAYESAELMNNDPRWKRAG